MRQALCLCFYMGVKADSGSSKSLSSVRLAWCFSLDALVDFRYFRTKPAREVMPSSSNKNPITESIAQMPSLADPVAAWHGPATIVKSTRQVFFIVLSIKQAEIFNAGQMNTALTSVSKFRNGKCYST